MIMPSLASEEHLETLVNYYWSRCSEILQFKTDYNTIVVFVSHNLMTQTPSLTSYTVFYFNKTSIYRPPTKIATFNTISNVLKQMPDNIIQYAALVIKELPKKSSV